MSHFYPGLKLTSFKELPLPIFISSLFVNQDILYFFQRLPLFIELMPHLSHVKQIYSQPMHLTHELIQWIQITRGRAHFNRDSTVKRLAPSFEPVIFRPRSSLICSCTFLTGLGHFQGSTRSGPIQVASTLGDRFAAVTSKLYRTQPRLSQSLYTL